LPSESIAKSFIPVSIPTFEFVFSNGKYSTSQVMLT